MSHRCFAAQCDRQVPDNMLMCGAHWRRVPRAIQKTIWATAGTGSPDYPVAVKEACVAVAEKEGWPKVVAEIHLEQCWEERFGVPLK